MLVRNGIGEKYMSRDRTETLLSVGANSVFEFSTQEASHTDVSGAVSDKVPDFTLDEASYRNQDALSMASFDSDKTFSFIKDQHQEQGGMANDSSAILDEPYEDDDVLNQSDDFSKTFRNDPISAILNDSAFQVKAILEGLSEAIDASDQEHTLTEEAAIIVNKSADGAHDISAKSDRSQGVDYDSVSEGSNYHEQSEEIEGTVAELPEGETDFASGVNTSSVIADNDDDYTVSKLKRLFKDYQTHMQRRGYNDNFGEDKLKYTKEIVTTLESDKGSVEKIKDVKSLLQKEDVQFAFSRNCDKGLVLLKAVSCLLVIPLVAMLVYSKKSHNTWDFFRSKGGEVLEKANETIIRAAAHSA